MPNNTQKNFASGGGSRGRSKSRGRSGSRGRAVSRNTVRNGSPITLALPLNSTKALPSVSYKNYFGHQYYPYANGVRTPGGTILAEYHKVGPPSPQTLRRYPSVGSSNGSSSSYNSNVNSEEMFATANAAARFNRLYPAIRPRSANRPEYNFGAYRRGRNPLGRRESF